MFDEFPATLSPHAENAVRASHRPGGALGPKLVLGVFVVAMACDVMGRVAQHLFIRALRRPLALLARRQDTRIV